MTTTPDPLRAALEPHPDDDFVARAQRYRDEHEATHEDEMCGGPCIVLGLTGDTARPGLDVAALREMRAAASSAYRFLDMGRCPDCRLPWPKGYVHECRTRLTEDQP